MPALVAMTARCRMLVLVFLVLASSVFLACAQPRPTSDPLGPLQAPGYLPPAILAKVVDFRGTCSWGRAPGNPAIYRVRLRVRTTVSGTILVRSNAAFDPGDTSNILGELPSESVAFGDGPVHDSRSDRRGWAIVVRGSTGRVCRGYVSDSSVSVVRDR